MIVVAIFGSQLYGRVSVFAKTHIATQFDFIWYVPFVPTRSSYLVVPLEGGGTGALPMRFNARAILSVYLTVWGGLAALFVALMEGLVTGPVRGVTVAALGAAGVAVVRKLFERAPLEERARRVAVNDVIAFPVDASLLLPECSASFYAWVAPAVDRASSALGFDYRAPSGGEGFWREAALHERMVDADFLKGAFARALLEVSLKKGDEAALRALAEKIWARLRAVEPELFARAQADGVLARKPCRIREEINYEATAGRPVVEGAPEQPAAPAAWPSHRPVRVPAPMTAAAFRMRGLKMRGVGAMMTAFGALLVTDIDAGFFATMFESREDGLIFPLIAGTVLGCGLYFLVSGSPYDRFQRLRATFKAGLLGTIGLAGVAALIVRLFA